MSVELLNTPTWRIARHVSSADTLKTAYKPTDFVQGQSVSVSPYNRILLRVFGRDAAAEACRLVTSGFMSNVTDKSQKTGRGPGFKLWDGTVALGARTYSEVPIDHPDIVNTANWFEADSFTPTVTDGQETLITSTGQGMILLNTLGYTELMFEIAATYTMAETLVVWRPCGMGGV